MGRGRQKAKQTKIARKLKYLTTDTDYDELAKELNHHDIDEDVVDGVDDAQAASTGSTSDLSEESTHISEDSESSSEDLDDYAAWAAEAAKRAEEKPASTPVAHKPFPKIPVPGITKPKK